ncbi:acid phosphatase [Lactifluus volemus]|nr:acid phosphatase [Lactifluus volemus]
MTCVLVLASLLWWLWSCNTPRTILTPLSGLAPADRVPDIGFPEDMLRTWAQYAPYIPAGKYVLPPPVCSISQLQRHGSRWPTTNSGAEMKSAVHKLQRAKHYKEDYLTFLKTFEWDLKVNDLLPLGAKQSYEAGVVAFERYAHIVTKDNLSFIRAASSPRVVDSATNWSAGFTVASHNKIKAKVDLILPESGNITLDDTMCPNAGDGDAESKKWLDVFAPSITKRLNSAAPGAKLHDKDTHKLMSLCAFHSQITMEPSPFCGLFTAEEFKGYEYYADVNKFYHTGYGGYLGRVQGVGYVNELLARLTGKPVRDHTQTNRTLDASPETFPLDRVLYVDFSHDNEIVAIYSALGLFRQQTRMHRPLPLPFGTFVRVLVNDVVQPLEFCGGIAGLCELHVFVASQRYARHDGMAFRVNLWWFELYWIQL